MSVRRSTPDNLDHIMSTTRHLLHKPFDVNTLFDVFTDVQAGVRTVQQVRNRFVIDLQVRAANEILETLLLFLTIEEVEDVFEGAWH